MDTLLDTSFKVVLKHTHNSCFRAETLLRKVMYIPVNPSFINACSNKSGVREGLNYMSLVLRKPVFGVSDQVRHKPGCTTTENG